MERKNNEVIDDLLGYEGLKIFQRKDIFNFSLDSALLGYFVSINLKDKVILDLGCGNGFIPLFLTLRTKAHITGIEIQEEIANLAKKSVTLNNLENQITIINDDMKNISKYFPNTTVDVVTSNPPYFKYDENSLIKESIYQTIARHEMKITLDDCVKIASITLKDGGTFAMVHRSNRLVDIILTFRKYHIEPKRIQFVYAKTTSSESTAILIEGKKSQKTDGLKILPPLYITDENNNYTKEALEIFNFKPKTGE